MFTFEKVKFEGRDEWERKLHKVEHCPFSHLGCYLAFVLQLTHELVEQGHYLQDTLLVVLFLLDALTEVLSIMHIWLLVSQKLSHPQEKRRIALLIRVPEVFLLLLFLEVAVLQQFLEFLSPGTGKWPQMIQWKLRSLLVQRHYIFYKVQSLALGEGEPGCSSGFSSLYLRFWACLPFLWSSSCESEDFLCKIR